MSKIKILLIDPAYYNKYSQSYLTVPLGIGYISSYINNLHPNADIEIHKNPQDALDSLSLIKPNIVGLSIFYWNTALVKLMIRQIRKMYGDSVLIVLGGQSIDDLPTLQDKMLLETNADALVPGEGELGFANIVESLMKSKKSPATYEALEGVVYHPRHKIKRVKSINFDISLLDIPSPYLNGSLDKFLCGDYEPIIQTSRLCPYTCVFCTVGKNDGKLRAFDLTITSQEIDYIADKMRNFPIKTLLLSDDNFGIFERDAQIAQHIADANKKYNYPKSVYFYSDKNLTKSSMEVIDKLKNLSSQGLPIALQSSNKETLKAVKRKNLSDDKIDLAIEWASEKNIHTTTELLFGLPFETKESFTQSMKQIVQRGIDSVLCHNVFVLPGSEMDRPYYREEHQLKTKFRLLGSNYAEVAGDFAAEHDEVVVGSKDFNFEDFLVIRHLNFMFYTVFTLDFYKWFFQLLRLEGIDIVKIFTQFMHPDRTKQWPKEYLKFLDDFNYSVENELFDTKEEVTAYAKKCWEKNDKNVGEPARINILFGARLIYMENWVYDVMLEISTLLIDDTNTLNKTIEILDICKRERIDLKNNSSKKDTVCRYDLNRWKKAKFKNKIDDFYIGVHKVSFSIDIDSNEKISAFNKKFSDLEDLDYYYSAIDSISPRHKTLHTLTFKERN